MVACTSNSLHNFARFSSAALIEHSDHWMIWAVGASSWMMRSLVWTPVRHDHWAGVFCSRFHCVCVSLIRAVIACAFVIARDCITWPMLASNTFKCFSPPMEEVRKNCRLQLHGSWINLVSIPQLYKPQTNLFLTNLLTCSKTIRETIENKTSQGIRAIFEK